MNSLLCTNRTLAAIGCVLTIGLVSVSIRGIVLSVRLRFDIDALQVPPTFLEFLQIQMSNWACTSIAHGLLTLLISSVCIWPSLLINVGISSSVERKYMLDIRLY